MNERFEELKRRAVAEADTSHIDFDNMSHTEIQMLGDIAVERKFAELIVLECVSAITDDDLAKECGTFLMDSYAKGIRYSAEVIKEHFGVEL